MSPPSFSGACPPPDKPSGPRAPQRVAAPLAEPSTAPVPCSAGVTGAVPQPGDSIPPSDRIASSCY